MRNVTSESVLFLPQIYSSLREGRRNEDRRYALLLLAMEVVSFILDLFGGSHWGYLLASFLLSALVLETTIYAYFIKRSTIKSEAQQLIVVEIVFSVLQLIISCYCLIRTLSGVETNYSSSVFPLAYATISTVFTFKRKKGVLHLSSNTPSNQVGIVEGTGESELESIRVDPPDPTLVSVPASDANVDPPNPMLVSVPASDANFDPPDPTSVSVPARDANVDPPDPTLVPVPARVAKVPHAKKLRRRNKQTQLSSVKQARLKEQVVKVDLPNDKAKNKDRNKPKNKAKRTPSRISGVDSIATNRKEQKLTITATRGVDPIDLVSELRKKSYADIVSLGPAKPTENKAKRTLSPISGVDSIATDRKEHKLTLTGTRRVDPIDLVSEPKKKSYAEILSLGPTKPTENKAKKTLSPISGVDSMATHKKEQKLPLTATGGVDPIDVVSEPRKKSYAEIVSVGPAKQPKTGVRRRSWRKRRV